MEPCLACGQLVHPVAGRCKHCRADLAALRTARDRSQQKAARQAAAGPMPPLTLGAADRAVVIARSPSATRRRIAVVLAALLVLGVGVAGGVVAHRLTATAPAAPDAAKPASWGAVSYPPPGAPAPTARPAPAPPRARPQAPASDDVSRFASQLAGGLCDKLAECGVVDGTARLVCEALSSELRDHDVVARVARGECQWDADAARDCLSAIGEVRCEAPGSPGALMAMAGGIVACGQALACD